MDHSSQSNLQSNGLILRRTVVLVGMMGCGKSAVGRALSSKLGVPLLDSDAEIERAANATITEIFERDGEEFFRAREAEIIERLLSGPACILSTGGGAFLAERNRKAIHDKGASVWLKADLDLLWERVRHKDTRPLLRTPNPKKTLTEIFNARVPLYALADLTVETKPGYAIEETANLVIRTLLTRPDILEQT